ncbi:hypothetical protein F5880DRAFT_1580039 [Lentinula raphanica]|nr:hypothetical protein F5880DRAFT_1580039 [Lentinula raphanica]
MLCSLSLVYAARVLSSRFPSNFFSIGHQGCHFAYFNKRLSNSRIWADYRSRDDGLTLGTSKSGTANETTEIHSLVPRGISTGETKNGQRTRIREKSHRGPAHSGAQRCWILSGSSRRSHSQGQAQVLCRGHYKQSNSLDGKPCVDKSELIALIIRTSVRSNPSHSSEVFCCSQSNVQLGG